MATPLHHDQPQQSLRVLQTLKTNSKKHAENSMSSDCVARKFAFPEPNMSAVQPAQQAENPTNQRDSQHRRGAQQLPPRPPLSPTQMHYRQQQQQQNLRQRHQASSTDPVSAVIRLDNPRLSIPVRSHGESSLPHPGFDRPHIASSVKGPLEDPHVLSLPEGRIHHANIKEQSSLQQQPDCQHVVSTGETIFHRGKVLEHSSLHPHQQRQGNHRGRHSPHAEAQNTAETEEDQPTQKLESSHTLDYKAALTQNIRIEQPHSQQSAGQCHEQPSIQDTMEDYFGLKQDEKRQGRGQSFRLDCPKQAEKNLQPCHDFSKMQHLPAEEHPDISSGDHPHAVSGRVTQQTKVAKQHHQKQSDYHLVVCSLENFQVADQATVDHETAADTTTMPQNHDSVSPRRLHECELELSEASPEDSYFHVSKELVEQDYQNECHLAASSTNPQICGHVYDYSRAGVTLVENNLNVVRELQLEKDQCRNEKSLLGQMSYTQECKEDYCEQPDTQNHPAILEHQLQDVESPPLFLGFNQNSTRFACGTSKGFRVYDIDSMKECFSSMVGGVGIVELLLNNHTFLLVGGGPNPSFPPNKVVLWDGLKGESCGERSHNYPILAVKVRQDWLVVVVENEIFISNSGSGKLLFKVITISNPRGLCAISINEGPSILACPGLKKGEVRIEHIGMSREQDELPTRSSFVIAAHDSGLACMALTMDGSLLATASDRGTLIRVFNTHDGTPLKEVRRGMDRAEIFSIAFSFSSDWLAVSSDKGTVHVFGLSPIRFKTTETNPTSSTTMVKNPGSTLSFIKGVLPKYFSSEWSAAQFKLPEEMKSVVAFGQEKHIIFILGTDGSFYKCSFDPEHGGDMKQLEYLNFMKPREART